MLVRRRGTARTEKVNQSDAIMKKGLLLVVALLGIVCGAKGQTTMTKNSIVLSAGVGIGTALDIGRTVVPPIVFQGEYGVVDHLFDAHSAIGVGACIGYAAGQKTYDRLFYQYITSVLLGVRGTFHYEFVERLDTYAGIMLGGNIANTRNEGIWPGAGNPPRNGGFVGDFYLGAKYYVLPYMAVYGEFGFGVAYFTLGVSFKL